MVCMEVCVGVFMSVYRGFCVEQLRLRCVKLYVLCVCVVCDKIYFLNLKLVVMLVSFGVRDLQFEYSYFAAGDAAI